MNNCAQTWFGQPRGLTILFLTEMWEIFSYYGMRSLLVYYMTKELLIGQEKSSLIYGTYTAMAYFTPIVGGLIADRWLGKRRAVIIGGSVMALGHFLMTFEPLLYLALGTIALGNGLFLPSLPSQIDGLYRPDDPRLGWAYNVYYVGINIGGFLAPLICGTLGEFYGWHWGFAAAGVGMLAGLLIYLFGGRYLPEAAPAAPARRAVADTGAAASGDAGPDGAPGSHRQTYLLLLGVCLSVTVFRGAYEQMGNTVALWADAGIDRTTPLLTVPMTWFQALNPLLVIVMTPVLLARWKRRAAVGRELSSMQKMAVGALVVAVAFLLLAAVASMAGTGRAGALWLVAFFFIFTLGELYVLPTGLGLFARLAPDELRATTVAAWFLTIFSGSLAAGAVGTLWSAMSHAQFFLMASGIAAVSAALSFSLDRRAQHVERVHADSIRALQLEKS